MAIHLGQFVDCHSRLGSFAMTNRCVFISSPHRSAAPAPDGNETGGPWASRPNREWHGRPAREKDSVVLFDWFSRAGRPCHRFPLRARRPCPMEFPRRSVATKQSIQLDRHALVPRARDDKQTCELSDVSPLPGSYRLSSLMMIFLNCSRLGGLFHLPSRLLP